jgi:RNA polymerase sigma factor (TIGR02999 family)
MEGASKSDITRLLRKASSGDDSALAGLVPLVYQEMRRLAAAHLRRERPDHTLQATALVHEAYLRMIKQEDVNWQNRAHFYRVAAQAIRHILVDHARHRRSLKRGGHRRRVSLDDNLALLDEQDVDVLALDEAMTRLVLVHERAAHVVELRFYAGLTREDVADYLGVSVRTVADDWRFARAWLRHELAPGAD